MNWRILAAFAMAAVLHGIGTTLIDGFSAPFAVRALLVLASLLAVASFGQTLVVLLGGIDLSVPFLIGVGNVVAAQLYGQGVPFALVCAIVATLAGLIGALNGFLSTALSVHPLILTLGSGTAVQGAVLLWTAGFPAGSAPQFVADFVSIGGGVGPLPVPGIVPATVVLALLLMLLLTRTPFGQRLYALGANPTAAPFALIRPVRMATATYAISAVFAAGAGVLLLGFTGSAYADVGQPYLFQAIAAVVIGGTALTGGQGGIAGTVAGALVLTETNTLLIGLGLPPASVEAALGAVILALVSVYGRTPSLRASI
jgi:ribose transport system permease protein